MPPMATTASKGFTDAAATLTSTSPGPATGSGTSITAADESNDDNANTFIATSSTRRYGVRNSALLSAYSPEGALRHLRQGVELGVRELDLQRAHVLLQVPERQCAGDRQRRRRAPQEPREADLRRRGSVALGDVVERAGGAPHEREEGDEH